MRNNATIPFDDIVVLIQGQLADVSVVTPKVVLTLQLNVPFVKVSLTPRIFISFLSTDFNNPLESEFKMTIKNVLCCLPFVLYCVMMICFLLNCF